MNKKQNKVEYVPDKPDKADWVQLKTKVPRPLRSKLKIEAATLDKPLESYLLALWDMREGNYHKLKAQKDLEGKAKRRKKTLDKKGT